MLRPSLRRATGLLMLAAFAASCATTQAARGDLDALKPALENFHKRLRWQDFHGAAELLVPERRARFLAESDLRNDERDLTITDFELLEVDVEPGGAFATGVSKVSWVRLPDPTQRTKTVRTGLVWSNNLWLIESQSAGPFAADLPRVDHAAPSSRDAGT